MIEQKDEKLKKYKQDVAKRLAAVVPVLQKVAMGDFTGKIEIPEKEDEFTELLVGLSLMMDDLRELEKTRKETEEAKVAAAAEKEKRIVAEEYAKKLEASEAKLQVINQQLVTSQKQLQEKIVELETFHKLTIGREEKLLELKERIKELEGQLETTKPKS